MNSATYDANYTTGPVLYQNFGYSFAAGERLIVSANTPSSGTSIVTALTVVGSVTTSITSGVPGVMTYTLIEDLDSTGKGVSWGITGGTGGTLNATWTVECIAAPTLTPTFGSITRTADGYTTQVSNYDPEFTWSASTTSGASTVSETGLVTVSDLPPSTSATVTVSTARFGYSTGSASATGDALAAGTVPTFDTPISTADGFLVGITNWNPHVTWSVSTNAGAANITGGSTVTVSGLSAGQSATVTVSTSQAGSVDGQADVTASANPGAPGAPSMFLAGAGNSEVTVSWLAPSSDGGSAILDYRVTADPGGQLCTTPDGSTTTCVMTGLTNGISYSFTVTARNALGVGPASSAIGPVTPRPDPVAPDAPTGVGGEAGDGLVEVLWVAPANNGGASIEGYQVQVANSPGGSFVDAAGACSPASTDWPAVQCQATGLTNGVAYSFKVRAKNAVGWSSYSSVSSALTPTAAPAPTPSAPNSGGAGNPSPAPTPLIQPALVPAKEAELAPAPSVVSAQPAAKTFTIRFANSSAKLSAQSKQQLATIAQQSRNSQEAITFASARLTPKGATTANRVLADQRTTRVCSYFRSVKLKGSCNTKTWVLKPGKPGIGPAVVVRITLTPQ